MLNQRYGLHAHAADGGGDDNGASGDKPSDPHGGNGDSDSGESTPQTE